MNATRECTAAEYLRHGARVASVAQVGILNRACEYAFGANMWAAVNEPLHAKDNARMAVTLAVLAFPDLGQPGTLQVVA
jgi:hypothetical protein